MPGMACQNAWDSDRGTIWHPGTSGEQAHTAIYMQNILVIRRIKVDQYSWVSGHASKMELEVNGEHLDLHDVPGSVPQHSAMEWRTGQKQLKSNLVKLRITEVGPRHGSAFGGIQKIELWGCWSGIGEKVKEPKKTTKSSIKTIRAKKPFLEEDIFQFDSSSSSLAGPALPKQEAAQLTLPLLGGGVAILTMGLCVWMVVYGVRARDNYLVTDGPRVRISPSSHVNESQDRLEMMDEEEEDIHTIPYP